MPRSKPARLLASCLLFFLASDASLGADDSLRSRTEVLETPTVEVVGTMPVPGLGVQRNQIPSNVAGATAVDIARKGATDLASTLAATLPGVTVDQAQGNARQADVMYRGFIASPRIGVPQGLSVFLDGARINEPFGDVVHWGLIPQNAIASISLIPGSNPMFGLNTLGGALTLRTKSGEHFPGTELETSVGSFGHLGINAEHGGNQGDRSWYLAASADKDTGWRDHSPSRVGLLFAKFGRQAADYDVDISVLAGSNSLTGNQLTPESFLRRNWHSIYTYPDRARHDLATVIGNGSRWLDDKRLLAANTYLRVLRLRESNSDLNEINDRRFGVVPFEGGANDGAAGANIDSAAINRLRLDQTGVGVNLNHTWLRGDDDRLTVGASIDHARSQYVQSYQLGSFNADRSATATGNETESVNIDGETTTAAAYINMLTRIATDLDLTTALRFNTTRVRTVERGIPQPAPALGLGNDFTYRSMNPALGASWAFAPGANTYAGINRGTRAPSPVELGCADRNSPCMLSNAFGSDPYLKQVVATTIEAGLRGKRRTLEWQVGAFRTDLRDDILFISAGGGTSRGYFSNIGTTRRVGIEAALGVRETDGLSWSARYNFLEASFRSEVVLTSQNNSTRDTDPTLANDEIRVRPGNVMPGNPRHHLNLSWSWNTGGDGAGWSATASMRAISRAYVRGNENNRHQAGTVVGLTDTRTYAGDGETPGYAVIDLNVKWRFDKRTSLAARVGNIFDRRYNTGGFLAENAFPGGSFAVDSNNWTRETFFSPGSPRNLWLALSHKFD